MGYVDSCLVSTLPFGVDQELVQLVSTVLIVVSANIIVREPQEWANSRRKNDVALDKTAMVQYRSNGTPGWCGCPQTIDVSKCCLEDITNVKESPYTRK
jgi:hypothetical protein